MENLQTKLPELASKAIAHLERVIEGSPKLQQLLPNGWRPRMARLRTSADRAIEALETFAEGGRDSEIAEAFRHGFRFRGYFKFVHPNGTAGKARRDLDAYKEVFDNRYTQYYPHEHLDRFPDAHDADEAKRADGTVTPDGHGTGAKDLKPHIPKYLRENLESLAGLLADIDLNWARLTFSVGNAKWSSDDDEEWNEWLAKLGHALHAVEDFFAHSNFVEHAVKNRADLRRLLPAEEKWNFGDGAWEVFTKRLKKYEGKQKANPSDSRELKALKDETNVVTGYFDFIDTIFSLRHVAAELLGHESHGSAKNAAWNMESIVRSTIQEVKNELRGKKFATKDESKEAAKTAALKVRLSSNLVVGKRASRGPKHLFCSVRAIGDRGSIFAETPDAGPCRLGD